MADTTKTTRKRSASQRPPFSPKSAPGDATGRAREAAQHAQQQEAESREHELTMSTRRAQIAMDEAVDMQETHEQALRESGRTDEEVAAVEYVDVVPIEDIDCFISMTEYHLKAGQTARIPLEHADHHMAGWLYPY